jgi:glyoxylase-like metal-dependent hydrolase (beta-lactamase superfamily II)
VTELITKILKLEEEWAPLCKSYIDELRANNKTKKVYAVDPYAEVYQFRDNLYGIYTQNLDGMGPPWMYLIIGPEKAMLIDTSFGLGNLKGLVDEITGGMPIVVVNTHSHPDHALGNCQFEKVYCHEYDVPYLQKTIDPYAWDYLFDEGGKPKWALFDRKDIVPFSTYEIAGCKDGFIFNLGGSYDIELVFLGGHEAGHAGFLDKQGRTFFCGDDIIGMRVGIGGPRPGMPYGEYGTVTGLRDNLAKLVKRIDEFDSLFPGHFIVDLDKSVVQDMIDACNKIIEDPSTYDFTTTGKHGVMKQKFVRNLGTIAYNDHSV